MSTCIDRSQFVSGNFISQDDAAYANWLHSVLGSRQLHANYGYEQGSGYWGLSSEAALEFQSSGGATGPGNIRFKGSTSAQYVYQTVALATGDDNESYRAAINYKVAGGNHVGQARGALFRQTIDYQGSNSCSYADGLASLNSPQVVGGFVAHSDTGWRSVNGVTSWTFAGGGWSNPANQDGYKMQIRVYENVVDNTGAAQWLYLDNVRGEGT